MIKNNFLVVFLMIAGLGLASSSTTSAQSTAQPQANSIGQVATLQGNATVTRNNAAPTPLKVNDDIFKNDVLQTGGNGALGVTFDDETTFNLSANARIVIDEFVYQEGGAKNSALFNIGRGTVAFVASQVAKTGDMKITTPTATMGIRGTTGVVDVPESAAGGTAEAKIKLYPDANGTVGHIEVFNPQGARLGTLSQGASAFAIRRDGGRFAAVPFQISAQESARDRNIVQRLFQTHNVGRQMAIQRRNSRGPNLQRQNLQQQRLRPGQGVQPTSPAIPGQIEKPGQPSRFKRGLQKLNPFAPKRREQQLR